MLRTVLHTTIFWAYIVLLMPVFFAVGVVVFVVTAPFDRKGKVIHYFTSFWCGHNVVLNPMWRLSIEGKERLDPKVAYVFCSNHQSAGDIPVLFNLYLPFKWVSKHQNFLVPFMGWAMYLNRYVRLVRGDMRSIARTLGECRRWLNKGVSVMMFPEGTRSKDGAFLPFKPGAFHLARVAHAPIVPIVLDGTLEALPADMVLRQKGVVKVRVLIGEPIDPKAYESTNALTEAVRAKMVAMQRELWEARGYAGPEPAAQAIDTAAA